MSKHISLSGLKTLLEPLVHLINKKAERPDWNENDPSSPSYIAGRTHYEEVGLVDIVPNTTAYIEEYYELPPFGLVEGQSYTVVWMDEEYTCTAFKYDLSGIDVYGLGFDLTNQTGIETYPFSIASDAEYGQVVPRDGSGSYTFSIAGYAPTIHKIDEKYLPDYQGKNIGKAGTAEGAEIFNNYEDNVASDLYAHAEGSYTTASSYSSHAEGSHTTADGNSSHAEGSNTFADGDESHAEGWQTSAIGHCSHSEGCKTIANDFASHSEGWFTVAKGQGQHVQGRGNIADEACAYAHIVGNGTLNQYHTDVKTYSNAHTLDWQGNAWYSGDVYVGSTSGTNKDEGSKKLATEEYVDEEIATIGADMLTIDITDIEQGTVTGINADTLGGKVASEYVSVTDFDAYKNEVSSEYTTKNYVQTELNALATNVQADLNQITTNVQTGLNQLTTDVASTYLKKTDSAVNSDKLGGVAASEYVLNSSLETIPIGIKSTGVGTVAVNFSCIVNGVKFISMKFTNVTCSANTSSVVCKLDTSFTNEVPVAISTNFAASTKVTMWIRPGGDVVISPGTNLSNAEIRIIGIGW